MRARTGMGLSPAPLWANRILLPSNMLKDDELVAEIKRHNKVLQESDSGDCSKPIRLKIEDRAFSVKRHRNLVDFHVAETQRANFVDTRFALLRGRRKPYLLRRGRGQRNHRQRSGI